MANKDSFENVMYDTLSKYFNSVEKDIDKVVRKGMKKGLEKVKKEAPKDTGEYSKGFAVRKNGDTFYIYTTRKWQLTHLLEFGHLTRDGKKRTKKIPHLYSNQDITYEYVNDEILNVIDNLKDIN